ncbi:Uncharacterized protein TCM_040657 [Theobroma cacao]|uniref:Uncharacterized protein n=1 Tax=Theobroma cacao TaxID=3641 RepID=A0A061GT15_THECC|nr:Uncharacterized protein TCM_040657 [Theobroma cacao]
MTNIWPGLAYALALCLIINNVAAHDDEPYNALPPYHQGHQNFKAIHSSKVVGEPPFFLASVVFFAIKDAIIVARAETGHTGCFPLNNPTTLERIKMACAV